MTAAFYSMPAGPRPRIAGRHGVGPAHWKRLTCAAAHSASGRALKNAANATAPTALTAAVSANGAA